MHAFAWSELGLIDRSPKVTFSHFLPKNKRTIFFNNEYNAALGRSSEPQTDLNQDFLLDDKSGN